MAFLIGLLTLVMVLDCLLLILLVLIQLPKKEAGAGIAFGSGATDALFGAGSGTVLTKITKWAAGLFFAMAVILSILQNSYHRSSGTAFANKLNQQEQTPLQSTAPSMSTSSTSASNAVVTTAPKNAEAPSVTGLSNPAPAASTVTSNAPTATPGAAK